MQQNAILALVGFRLSALEPSLLVLLACRVASLQVRVLLHPRINLFVRTLVAGWASSSLTGCGFLGYHILDLRLFATGT